MRKPLPQGLTGGDIIKISGKPNYQIYAEKAMDFEIKIVRFENLTKNINVQALLLINN